MPGTAIRQVASNCRGGPNDRPGSVRHVSHAAFNVVVAVAVADALIAIVMAGRSVRCSPGRPITVGIRVGSGGRNGLCLAASARLVTNVAFSAALTAT